jgi:nucleoside-diphosphate-sugar epimerase
MRHYADISKAKKILSFTPETDIHKGIGLYLDWFLSKHVNVSELMKQETVFNW